MRILSIEAWPNCDGDCGHIEDSKERCWTWNNWHTVGNIDIVPDDPIGYLVDEGYLKPLAREGCEVTDDQHNIVIIDRITGEPLYAFEYGNQ